MPLTAAVLNLSDDAVERRAALDWLRSDGRIELGPRQQLHLPVVVSTETVDEGIELMDETLPAVEGIEFARIVRVDFEDETGAADTARG